MVQRRGGHCNARVLVGLRFVGLEPGGFEDVAGPQFGMSGAAGKLVRADFESALA